MCCGLLRCAENNSKIRNRNRKFLQNWHKTNIVIALSTWMNSIQTKRIFNFVISFNLSLSFLTKYRRNLLLRQHTHTHTDARNEDHCLDVVEYLNGLLNGRYTRSIIVKHNKWTMIMNMIYESNSRFRAHHFGRFTKYSFFFRRLVSLFKVIHIEHKK